MKNIFNKFDYLSVFNKRTIIFFVMTIFLILTIVTLPRAFAQLQPIRSVEIFSEKLDYSNNQSGSFRITERAVWTSSGEATVTFDVESVVKRDSEYTDILLLIDVSKSMGEGKLRVLKSQAIELVNDILSDENNRVGLITITSSSQIVTGFTNNKQVLTEKINDLSLAGNRNYYRALINVDVILKNYNAEENRDCRALILTSGHQTEESPNDEIQYEYLKDNYPFLVVNCVQYVGNTIFEGNKIVSDEQYIADNNNLHDVLFLAAAKSAAYEKFLISDYINTNYFYVDKEKMTATQGKVSFNESNQKIDWLLDGIRTGTKSTLTIKLNIKSEFARKAGVYPISSEVVVNSKLGEISENITSHDTPALSNNYVVHYDVNAPADCVVDNISTEKSTFVFDVAEINKENPKCSGYQFKGWKIMTDNVSKINGDYFVMPENDVVLRGEWAKVKMEKSIDGQLYEYLPPVIQKVGVAYYGEKLWKYKHDITKIEFKNEITDVKNAKYSWDVSAANNGSVMAYLVPNSDDTTTYTAYIQADGNILANQDSSYLFNGFRKLKEIVGLRYFDTTNATDMSWMFYNCLALTTIDLSHFITSNVTDMSHMFQAYEKDVDLEMALTSLDLSMFDTSKVTDMSSMFYACRSLAVLRLTNFNTSKVTNMHSMFQGCRSLPYLVLRVFDTSSVTDMGYMFYNCVKASSFDLSNFDTSNVTDMSHMFQAYDEDGVLTMAVTHLDLSSFDTSSVTTMRSMFNKCSSLQSIQMDFDTSNVTEMSYMFNNCKSLVELNFLAFNTSKVTDMSYMFHNCSALEIVNLRSFDTSNVTDMSWMFYNCLKLTLLDLSSFNTSKVTDMSHMFQGYGSDGTGQMALKTIYMDSFNTSNVTSMQSMFFNCSNLTNLTLTNFNTAKVTTMNYMFYGCSKLTTTINISNTTGTYSYMFTKAATLSTAKITVNYKSASSSIVDSMIATKSTNSNVVKGKAI